MLWTLGGGLGGYGYGGYGLGGLGYGLLGYGLGLATGIGYGGYGGYGYGGYGGYGGFGSPFYSPFGYGGYSGYYGSPVYVNNVYVAGADPYRNRTYNRTADRSAGRR